MIQKLEKITLVNGPFEDHSTDNLPLQFLALKGPRKVEQVAQFQPRDQIMQVGLALRLVVVAVGLVVVVVRESQSRRNCGHRDRPRAARNTRCAAWSRPARWWRRYNRSPAFPHSPRAAAAPCANVPPPAPGCDSVSAGGFRCATATPCSRWWSPARRWRNTGRCEIECLRTRRRRQRLLKFEARRGERTLRERASVPERATAVLES